MITESKAKEPSETLDNVSKYLIIISGSLIVLSFFLPYLIVEKSVIPIDFIGSGEIGDTIGGIMNPFVTIAGILITFLAFYMQFRANVLQRKLFDKQILNDKNQFKEELGEQRNQFGRNLLETQFYEMIRLHKENVNDIFTTQLIVNTDGSRQHDFINGRKNFEFFLDEIGIAFFVAKKIYIKENDKYCFAKAYSVVFNGIKQNEELVAKKHDEENYCLFINKLVAIKINHGANNFEGLKNGDLKFYANNMSYNYKTKNDLRYEIFTGYSNFLGHYYRQLFQTVKFIVNQKVLTYKEKRNYLRILRAQLTNSEQVMLFYNWLSGYGIQWENNENHYFTDYRMIHNIYDDLLITNFSLIKIFNLMDNGGYLKENDRVTDPIFEFEDWG